MKTPEQKIAQRFVVLAYKRYRNNRQWANSVRNLKGDKESLLNIRDGSENEAWNHLQLAKQIYYEIL